MSFPKPDEVNAHFRTKINLIFDVVVLASL